MKFDKKYKVYTWKNRMYLHWMLNPGLVINELILGQRVPKLSLLDKTSNKPRYESSFIPCPHCETIHDDRTWSAANGTGFKNWFGLYCPNCKQIIPCLTNIFTGIILILTYPLWGWFQKSLKAKWLKKQPDRFKTINTPTTPKPINKKGWIFMGLTWGALMFVIMTFGFPFFMGEEINLKSISVGLVIWSIAGLIFGYTMKVFLNKTMSEN